MATGFEQQERRALWVSICGTAFMAVLGIIFAWLTHSEAVLLDGVFSGIGLVMSLLTLGVAGLVQQPDDEHFHYGYAHFTPLINVLKSLLMIVLCSFALLSSVRALLGGGRSMEVGSAVIYGIIATVGCILVAGYLKRASKHTGSPLVAVDSSGWVIDTLMSGAVLLSFVTGYLIKDSDWGIYLDYLDPTVVAVLCLLALPLPLRILARNGREVLLMAPARELQDEVIERAGLALASLPIDDFRLRMLKMGNTINVLLHIKLASDFELQGISQLDDLRKTVSLALAEMQGEVICELVFIDDMSLAD